jgi:hypothetical protein
VKHWKKLLWSLNNGVNKERKMRDYTEIARLERDGFEVIVDKTYEDIDPWSQLSECFDDRDELYRKINDGDLDWFMLRVRVMLDGHELGSHYLGGCLYDWNRVQDVMTDGTAEDCIYSALEEAKLEARRLVGSLQRVIDAQKV